MEENHVKFYFAYNSPYAFMANSRLAQMLAPLGTAIAYRPVYAPRTGGGGPDFSSPKMQYLLEDVARCAEAYGLKLNPGPFADSGKACRGFLFAEQAGEGAAYHDSVFQARWLDGKDIGDDQTLSAIAEACGLYGEAHRDAIEETSPYAQALEQSNAEAKADGAFGFPFFIYQGQKFWGNDRIEWLVRAISTQ